MAQEIEEMEERSGLILSMRSKLVCISLVYLVFMSLTTILSIDPISRELQVLFSKMEANLTGNVSELESNESLGQIDDQVGEQETIEPQEGEEMNDDSINEPNQTVGTLPDSSPLGLELKWAFNTSDQFPGKSFGAGHMGAITVWDVDGDGRKEVLWGTRRGDSKRLWCIKDDGSLKWVYPPIDVDGLPRDPTSKVSIIDVNNDGVFELCFGGRSGKLFVLRGDGSVLWIWDEPEGQSMNGAPQATDVDGDGFVEFFMNSNSGHIYRVNHLGELVWTSIQAGSGNSGHPTIADIDQDGYFEVLWASQDHNVYCASTKDGSIEWIYDSGANLDRVQVVVADVNKDGKYEAIVWARGPVSSLICISFYGRELWKHPFPPDPRYGEDEGASIRLSQAMGDVDDDGDLDMVLMSSTAALCVDMGGSSPVEKWQINFTQWGETGLVPGAVNSQWGGYHLIADIDGDDKQEVLWLAPFPIVTDAATGKLEAYYVNEHIAVGRRPENGGWWGDVDGDRVSEWIADLNGHSHPQSQVYCLTMGGKFPAKAYWPEYYHAALPSDIQESADWLLLKRTYSNSLWFPITETLTIAMLFFCCGCLQIKRKYSPLSTC